MKKARAQKSRATVPLSTKNTVANMGCMYLSEQLQDRYQSRLSDGVREVASKKGASHSDYLNAVCQPDCWRYGSQDVSTHGDPPVSGLRNMR